MPTTHQAPRSASATATAVVVEGDATAAGPSITAGATEGTPFNGTVATFVDGSDANNPPADFTSTIDWGDGTTSAGAVSEAATTSLDMSSQPGDYIGAGLTYHFTPATGAFSVSGNSANDSQIRFSYQEPNFGNWWYVDFAAPNGRPSSPASMKMLHEQLSIRRISPVWMSPATAAAATR